MQRCFFSPERGTVFQNDIKQTSVFRHWERHYAEMHRTVVLPLLNMHENCHLKGALQPVSRQYFFQHMTKTFFGLCGDVRGTDSAECLALPISVLPHYVRKVHIFQSMRGVSLFCSGLQPESEWGHQEWGLSHWEHWFT